MQANELLNDKPSKAELNAGLQILLAVSEAIREAWEIPSGTLYAMLCGKVTIQGYESMVRTLKNAGLVEETPTHLLRWVGPLGAARRTAIYETLQTIEARRRMK